MPPKVGRHIKISDPEFRGSPQLPTTRQVGPWKAAEPLAEAMGCSTGRCRLRQISGRGGSLFRHRRPHCSPLPPKAPGTNSTAFSLKDFPCHAWVPCAEEGCRQMKTDFLIIVCCLAKRKFAKGRSPSPRLPQPSLLPSCPPGSQSLRRETLAAVRLLAKLRAAKEQGVMKIVNLISCVRAGGDWQEKFPNHNESLP